MSAAVDAHPLVFSPGVDTGLEAAQIEQVFAQCFAHTERTCLRGGAPEPLYQPARDAATWHCIYYRADYAASALHEVAHWCIAGPARRQLPDYGYWYQPEGRDAAAQQAFAAVEARPQALEWVFSQAARRPFRLSLDNLEAPPAAEDLRAFAGLVLAAAEQLRAQGLAARAARFARALAAAADGPSLDRMQFTERALYCED